MQLDFHRIGNAQALKLVQLHQNLAKDYKETTIYIDRFKELAATWDLLSKSASIIGITAIVLKKTEILYCAFIAIVIGNGFSYYYFSKACQKTKSGELNLFNDWLTPGPNSLLAEWNQIRVLVISTFLNHGENVKNLNLSALSLGVEVGDLIKGISVALKNPELQKIYQKVLLPFFSDEDFNPNILCSFDQVKKFMDQMYELQCRFDDKDASKTIRNQDDYKSASEISDNEAEILIKSEIEKLELIPAGTFLISREQVASILKSCPNLKELNLGSLYSEKALEALQQLQLDVFSLQLVPDLNYKYDFARPEYLSYSVNAKSVSLDCQNFQREHTEKFLNTTIVQGCRAKTFKVINANGNINNENPEFATFERENDSNFTITRIDSPNLPLLEGRKARKKKHKRTESEQESV